MGFSGNRAPVGPDGQFTGNPHVAYRRPRAIGENRGVAPWSRLRPLRSLQSRRSRRVSVSACFPRASSPTPAWLRGSRASCQSPCRGSSSGTSLAGSWAWRARFSPRGCSTSPSASFSTAETTAPPGARGLPRSRPRAIPARARPRADRTSRRSGSSRRPGRTTGDRAS